MRHSALARPAAPDFISVPAHQDIDGRRSDEAMAVLADNAAAVDRDGAFPWAALDALHADGALGLTARLTDGGQEAGLADCAALVRDAGRACASTALILAMQLIHVRASWRGRWSRTLATRVGRSAAGCGALINALRVEPALGTPARGGLPTTMARRVEGGWSLSGRKIISTGAPGLRWAIVFARTDEASPRVGQFLVPAATAGLRIEPTWNQIGLRGSCSHDVVFEDVLIPADHAVDLRAPEGWAVRDADETAWNTVLIAALYTGVAEAARTWTASFLRGRVPANLGVPLATLPASQDAIGRVEARLFASRQLIEHAAAATDAGHPPGPEEAGLLKTVAAENALHAVQACLELTGIHGLARANPLERHLRDVLCARVHTPQPDAAYRAAGRQTLALQETV